MNCLFFRRALFVRAFTACVISLLSPFVAADTTPITLDQVSTICPENSTTPSVAASSTVSQRQQYCNSVHSDQAAASANAAMWKIWAAVAAICTAGCIAPYAVNMSNQYVCMVSQGAAGAADAIETKSLTTALMTLASVGGGYVLNRMVAPNAEEKEKLAREEAVNPEKTEKPAAKDYASCLLGAMAIYQAYSKHQSMTKEEDSALDNLKLAANIDTSATATSSAALQQAALTEVNPSTAAANQMLQLASTMAPPSQQSPCAGMMSGILTTTTVTQCAAATHSQLPNGVTQHDFSQLFKSNVGGMKLDDFYSKHSQPGSALIAAMAGVLPPEQTQQFATVLQNFEQGIIQTPAISTYHGGGGSRGSPKHGDDSAMDQLMTQLMEQWMPQQPKDATGGNTNAAEWMRHTLSDPQVAENSAISLFMRISYAYQHIHWLRPAVQPVRSQRNEGQ